MIEFAGAKPNGEEVIGIGLTHAELLSLASGRPKEIDCSELGFAGVNLLLISAPTDQAMATLLADNKLLPREVAMRVDRGRRFEWHKPTEG